VELLVENKHIIFRY